MIAEKIKNCVARDIVTCYALSIGVDVLTQVSPTAKLLSPRSRQYKFLILKRSVQAIHRRHSQVNT